MAERLWPTARAAAERLALTVRGNSGSGRDGRLTEDDLAPLMEALGVSTDAGPPPRPDTYMVVQGTWVWWTNPPGETDPTKVTVWVAPINGPDHEPDYTAAFEVEDIENWEGFPWEDRSPTFDEMAALRRSVIGALGFAAAGSPKNPLKQAATAIGDQVYQLVAAMNAAGGTTNGDPSNEAYETTVRSGLGGVYGDFAATANPDFMIAVSELLSTIAYGAEPSVVGEKATWVANHYLEAHHRNTNR